MLSLNLPAEISTRLAGFVVEFWRHPGSCRPKFCAGASAILFAFFPLSESRLSASQFTCLENGLRSVVTGSDGSRVLTERGPTVSEDFRFEGSLDGDFTEFVWPTNVRCTRALLSESVMRDGRTEDVRVTIDWGVPPPGERSLTEIWPAFLEKPGALAFVWFVGNKAVDVAIRPLPMAEPYLNFEISLSRRLSAADAQHCRVGVVAVQDGQILSPVAPSLAHLSPEAVRACIFDEPGILGTAGTGKADELNRLGGTSFLVFAVQCNSVRVVNHLMEVWPALRDFSSADGRSVLHYAAEAGKLSIVDLLLRLGAQASPTMGKDATTPLMFAAAGGHSSVVKRLIMGHARVDELSGAFPSGPLEAALVCGDSDSCELLRTAGAPWPEDERVAKRLVDAAGRGWITTVNWLLRFSNSRSVALGRDFALYNLVRGSADEEICRILLQAGADPNAESDLHGDGISPLTEACRRGAFGLAAVLIEKGALVDKKDSDGFTALGRMAAWGHPEAVRFLLARGANVNQRNGSNLTPLEIALFHGASGCAKALAEAGAELDLNSRRVENLLGSALRLDVAAVIESALRRGWNGRLLLGGKNLPAISVARAFSAKDCISVLDRYRPDGSEDGLDLVISKIQPKAVRPIKVMPLPTPKMASSSSLIPTSFCFEGILDNEGNLLFAGVADRPDISNLAQIIERLGKWRFAVPNLGGNAVAARVSFPVKIKTGLEESWNLSQVDVLPCRIEGSPLSRGLPATDKKRGIYFTVANDGTVKEMKASPASCSKELGSALQSLSDWKFTPARKAGEPVSVRLFYSLP